MDKQQWIEEYENQQSCANEVCFALNGCEKCAYKHNMTEEQLLKEAYHIFRTDMKNTTE